MARPDSARLTVHVAGLTSQHETFWVTPARVRAAAARHPDLARRLRFTWSWDLEGFAGKIARADLMIGWRFPHRELAAMAPRLRWIQLTGAGVEHLMPLDWLPRGVALTNNSGVHAEKAGEFAAAALLMINHGFPALATSQRRHAWEKQFTTTIAGKTVAFVGLGDMGRAAARWARRLGMEVIGVRRSGRPAGGIARVVGPEALDAVLPEADFVVVACPLTPETRNLLSRRRLARMKRGAGLVNIGRAGVVDYDALADALRAGRLSGAVLDVFDPEPLPEASPLWDVPNLVVVPHCSSDDRDRYIPMTLDLFFDNLGRFLAGRPLRNRVRAAGY